MGEAAFSATLSTALLALATGAAVLATTSGSACTLGGVVLRCVTPLPERRNAGMAQSASAVAL